jgi:hypothetical protein
MLRLTRGLAGLLVAGATLAATPAAALEVGSQGDLLSVDVHAFAGQGFIYTTHNNYLANDTTHGSFQLSEIGINFTKNVTDKFRMGVQLFAQDLGPTGNYDAKMDWFYLDYHFKDWLGLRAGRVKIPFGLYNELNDVDSGRVPVLLPQSVYPIQNRTYLLAQTGGEIYGYARMGGAGALDYRGYGGTIFVDTPSTPGGPQILTLAVPYLVGGRVLWETPLDGLRTGLSLQGLRLDTTILDQMKPVTANIVAVLGVASVEFAAHDLLLTAEYTATYGTVESSDATILPPGPTASEGAYAMGSYRVNKWLQPGVYYSVLFPKGTYLDGRENVQHDVATTLRFDITPNWLVKIEGHYMLGTGGLSSSMALNGNVPLSKLDPAWGVLLLRTTGYF